MFNWRVWGFLLLAICGGLLVPPINQSLKAGETGIQVENLPNLEKSANYRTAKPARAMQSLPFAPFGSYTENINGVLLELVRVPSGTFIMGSNSSPDPKEKPAHQVNVKSFYLGRYEVTSEQWNVVADTLPQVKIPVLLEFA